MNQPKQYPSSADDHEGILPAFRAAAQAKGAPLSDHERKAILESIFPDQR